MYNDFVVYSITKLVSHKVVVVVHSGVVTFAFSLHAPNVCRSKEGEGSDDYITLCLTQPTYQGFIKWAWLHYIADQVCHSVTPNDSFIGSGMPVNSCFQECV